MKTYFTTYFKHSLLRLSLFIFLVSLLHGYTNAQQAKQLRWEETEQGIKFHMQPVNGLAVTPELFDNYYLSEMDLDRSNSIKEVRRMEDEMGMVHIRYAHYINGVQVIGSDVVAHFRHNVLQSMNGELYKPQTTVSNLTEQQALDLALEAMDANTYKWEIEGEDAMLQSWTGNPNATYYPKGSLTYCPYDLNFRNYFALCYKFDIYAEDPLARKNIYINASTGEFWAEEELIHIIDAKGTAKTRYRGDQTITTDSLSPTSFRLRESGRGKGIETYDMNKGTSYTRAVDFTDGDNYWNNVNSNFDEVAGDAHFGAEMTYDYFKSKFNRNSYDGNGAKIRSYVHYGNRYVNAFWNGSVMTYGDGNGTSWFPLTSLDICGHEIAHAVTTNSAGLVYRYESGALNESFSDIFGNAIERYADSTQFNWRMGEDIMNSKNGIRNMANPKTHGDPSTYKGSYWHTSPSDNGGVHTNSGVQNYWFYLLCEGKTGTNDNGDKYSVDSLGMSKAEQIAFRNLTVYLTTSSQYDDARYYAIQSATDLYGNCSKEVEATTNAWYAVGVGKEYDSAHITVNFTADSMQCFNGDIVTFENRSLNAKSYYWDFGDGTTSTDANPTHAFNRQGYHTIKLVAEACHKGVKDSLTKRSFIKYDSTRDICNGYLMEQNDWKTVDICHGFIYDHSGEDDYLGLSKDTITIEHKPSLRGELTFLEFDYENNYDYVYVYDGYNTSGTLIGTYTGQSLPNSGRPITATSGAFTIVHTSDPLKVGTGFKAYFEAIRPTLSLTTSGNTFACQGQKITLKAVGKGGDVSDHIYLWNGVPGDSTMELTVTKDTVITIKFGDLCLEKYITKTFKVFVLEDITFTQSNDTTICQGSDVELLVDPSGGLGRYVFNYSTGGTDNFIPFTQKIESNLQPGTHHYWISFTDQCTPGIDTAFFTIQVRDSLGISLSDDTTICLGNSVQVNATPKGGKSDGYLFNWGKGTTAQNPITVRPSKDTTILVHLIDGCSSHEPVATTRVFVREGLSAIIHGPDTACFGETVEFTATTSGGIPSNHTLNWDNMTSTDQKYKKTIRSNETITLEVSDGCTEQNGLTSHDVVVRAPLSVNIPSVPAVCPGKTANLIANTTGGITGQHEVTWSNGLGTGFSKSVNPQQTTTYQVVLNDNCSDTATASVTVTVNPTPSVDFTVDKTATCIGLPVTFTNQSSSTLQNTFVWSFGDGQVSGRENPTNTYDKPGKYDVKLIVRNTFKCVDSLIKKEYIEIQELPVADFEFSPAHPDFINNTVHFTNRSKNATTYFWEFGDGATANSTNPINSYSDTGRYTINLRIENGIGCTDDTSLSLTVAEVYLLHIPNAFSPNNDGLNDQFRSYYRGFDDIEITVFNRYGVAIWWSDAITKAWDGTVKGKPAPLGLYYYKVKGTNNFGEEINRVGQVMLVR